MNAKLDQTSWLKGGKACCATMPPDPPRAYRLVLLGAPGVGKGTQAELLGERLGACHLSTGDVFRAAKGAAESELSPALVSALPYMNRGELVPDDIVVDMVRERVRCLKCCVGFLLDGFPRTVPQAESLDRMLGARRLALDAVISYEISNELVMTRLTGRRTCAKCKSVFHVVLLPPKKQGICDHCGGELYHREDDRPEVISVRLKEYAKRTSPLIDYYQQRGLLVSVVSGQTPQETFSRTLTALKTRLEVTR